MKTATNPSKKVETKAAEAQNIIELSSSSSTSRTSSSSHSSGTSTPLMILATIKKLWQSYLIPCLTGPEIHRFMVVSHTTHQICMERKNEKNEFFNPSLLCAPGDDGHDYTDVSNESNSLIRDDVPTGLALSARRYKVYWKWSINSDGSSIPVIRENKVLCFSDVVASDVVQTCADRYTSDFALAHGTQAAISCTLELDPAVKSYSYHVRLWSLANVLAEQPPPPSIYSTPVGHLLPPRFRFPENVTHRVRISSDGNVAGYFIADTQVANVWSLDVNGRTMPVHFPFICTTGGQTYRCAAFSGNGQRLVTANDGHVWIWNREAPSSQPSTAGTSAATTETKLFTLMRTLDDTFLAQSISASWRGDVIAVGGRNGLRIINIAESKRENVVVEAGRSINNVVLASHGRTVAYTTVDSGKSYLRIADTEGRRLQQLKIEEKTSFAATPNLQSLFFCVSSMLRTSSMKVIRFKPRNTEIKPSDTARIPTPTRCIVS